MTKNAVRVKRPGSPPAEDLRVDMQQANSRDWMRYVRAIRFCYCRMLHPFEIRYD